MTWVLAGSAIVVLLVYLYSLYTQGEIRRLVRTLRWIFGLAMMAAAAIVALRGNIMLGSFIAMGAAGVLMRGRLGPIDFGAGMSSANNTSTVKSRYFSMKLEHETGSVSGTVREGLFSGRDLASLGPDECWALYDEVSEDPDSIALLESWLDANRKGWREYFAEHFGMDDGQREETERPAGRSSGLGSIDEAYDVLGLKPGASADEIRRAHRELMKKVHPDHGGSSFLAARINEAKDMLLAHTKRSAR